MNNPTLQESAYRTIVTQIAAGAYAQGHWLREQRVAEELGISPTPVREAFRRLEREGWIEFVPRRGCRIRIPTLEEVEDLGFTTVVVRGRSGSPASAGLRAGFEQEALRSGRIDTR